MKDMIVEELNECIYPIAILENDMTLEEMYVLFFGVDYVKSIGIEIKEENGYK